MQAVADPAAEAAECCGIRCTEQSLCEIDSGRVMLRVRRHDVRRITLRHGVQALRPALQTVVGSALAALGYFPLRSTAEWVRHGGVFFDLESALIPMAAVGAWLVFGAMRRGYFLDVEQGDATKRLVFRGSPSADALDDFLDGVERRYGLTVERDV